MFIRRVVTQMPLGTRFGGYDEKDSSRYRRGYRPVSLVRGSTGIGSSHQLPGDVHRILCAGGVREVLRQIGKGEFGLHKRMSRRRPKRRKGDDDAEAKAKAAKVALVRPAARELNASEKSLARFHFMQKILLLVLAQINFPYVLPSLCIRRSGLSKRTL